MRKLITTLCVSFAVLLGSSSAKSDELIEVLNSYNSGDYITTLNILKNQPQNVNTGDLNIGAFDDEKEGMYSTTLSIRNANIILGVMYKYGKGIKKDKKKAYKLLQKGGVKHQVIMQMEKTYISPEELIGNKIATQSITTNKKKLLTLQKPLRANESVKKKQLVISEESKYSVELKQKKRLIKKAEDLLKEQELKQQLELEEKRLAELELKRLEIEKFRLEKAEKKKLELQAQQQLRDILINNQKKALKAYSRKNYTTAYSIWSKLAQNGDAKSNYNIGIMHYYGKGVTKSIEESEKWFRAAADQGFKKAQKKLLSVQNEISAQNTSFKKLQDPNTRFILAGADEDTIFLFNNSGRAKYGIRDLDGNIIFDKRIANFCYLNNPNASDGYDVSHSEYFSNFLKKRGVIGNPILLPKNCIDLKNIDDDILILNRGEFIKDLNKNISGRSSEILNLVKWNVFLKFAVFDFNKHMKMLETRKQDAKQLLVNVKANKKSGYGLISLKNITKTVCSIENTKVIKLIKRLKKDSPVVLKTLSTEDVKFDNTNNNFLNIKKGKCGSFFADARTLRRIILALERDHVKFTMHYQWINNPS